MPASANRTCAPILNLALACGVIAVAAGCASQAQPPASPRPPVEPVQVAAMDTESEPRTVSLNLTDAEALQVLSAFAQAAEQPLVVDPAAQRVARCARMTIVTPAPVRSSELVPLLQRALEPAGLQLSREGAGWVVQRDGSTRAVDECSDSRVESANAVLDEPTMTESEFRSAVRKVSDTRYDVARRALDALLTNQASWMRSARLVPSVTDGKTDGVRVFGIRADSAMHVLGFRNGDMLISVMGLSMTSPDQALEAYGKARGAAVIPVVVRRRGRDITIEYFIVTP